MINIRILLFIFLLSAKKPVISNINNLHKKNNTISTEDNADEILGKWITVEKTLEVEVYKVNGIYRPKIIWFTVQDKTRPMNTRMDEKNPNPELRTRKWIGMEVLKNLTYDEENKEWENGIIYDAKNGRYWDSVAWINKSGLMKVKGYWVFRWISETLTFKRVS